MNSAKPSTGKDAILINCISSVLRIALQITVLVWVNQYLLKRIQPEEYAIFPLVMSLVVFADLFKNIFVGGIARYIVEADARDDHAGVTRVVSSMFPFLLAAAATLGVCWRVGGLEDRQLAAD